MYFLFDCCIYIIWSYLAANVTSSKFFGKESFSQSFVMICRAHNFFLFFRKTWYKVFTFSTISRECMLVIQVTRNRPRFSRLFLSCNLRHDLLSPNYGAKMQNVKDYIEKLEDESSGSGKVQKSFLAPSFSRSDVNFPQISIWSSDSS